jgi:predicted nucleic acid-binding protein
VGSIVSLQGKLVAVDTSLFIYFVERHPKYHPVVRPFFAAVDRGEIKIVTSILTLTEVLVLPLRLRDQQLVDRYTRISPKGREHSQRRGFGQYRDRSGKP